MRRAFFTVFALAAGIASAGEPPIPKSLQGCWVPASSSCRSELGVLLAANSVEFRNKNKRHLVPTQACFSCEGGAKYSGVVVWVSPSAPGKSEFTLYLNAEEQEGVAKVEIDGAAMSAAFPLHNVALRRCDT